MGGGANSAFAMPFMKKPINSVLGRGSSTFQLNLSRFGH